MIDKKKINKIERQISGLEEQFRAVKKEPTSPKQLALFSRKKRFAKAGERMNLYHSTLADFAEFKKMPFTGIPQYGRGTYLFDNKDAANIAAGDLTLLQPEEERADYVPSGWEGSKIIPVTVDVENLKLKSIENYESFLSKVESTNLNSQLDYYPKDEWETISLNYTSGTTGDPKGVLYHHRGAHLMCLN